MLRIVLMLLLGLIACQQDFAFDDVELYDGDLCRLTSGGMGQCQLFGECGKKYADRRKICGFVGLEPIICCDVVRRQCEGILPAKSMHLRSSNHVAGNTSQAEVGEFPFMALITYRNNGSEASDEDISHRRCGAAVVSKRFLLTAAHCLRNETYIKPYSVKLGTNEADDALADSFLIDTVYMHEEYSFKNKQNDIGIVKLVEDITLTVSIKPICLYTNPEDLSESTDLTVMGWGKQSDEELSNVLLKGTVRPVLRTTCQERFNKGFSKRILLKDTHMCALGDKDINGTATDACQGDSGGPMVLKEGDHTYLVAIVSAGQGCGSEHHAGIYTRVSKFLSWIIQKGVFRIL